MTQFELLVLSGTFSITVGLTWALMVIRLAKSSKSFRITSFAAAIVSIVLFIVSLFYIIENLGLEAPRKDWESPFLWGWILLCISFFVMYAGLARETAAG